MKAAELADRIRAHLHRFEQDAKINAPRASHAGTRPYYHAGAYATGNGRVGVTYITYQNTSMLSKDEATRYLAKLDAGFVGRHFEALREGI